MEQRQREVLGKGLVKVLSSQTRYPQSSARAAEKGWAKTWDARMRLADNSFIDFGSSHQAGNNLLAPKNGTSASASLRPGAPS